MIARWRKELKSRLNEIDNNISEVKIRAMKRGFNKQTQNSIHVYETEHKFINSLLSPTIPINKVLRKNGFNQSLQRKFD